MALKAPDTKSSQTMALRISQKRGALKNSVADRPSKKARTTVSPPNGVAEPASKRAKTTHAQKRNSRGHEVKFIPGPPTDKLQVFVCGEGSSGELGLGPKNALDVKAPRPNPNLEGVVAVATGGMHCAALSTKNEILTWGINDHETLGRNTTWDGGLKDADAMDVDSNSDSEDEGDLNPLESTPTAIRAGLFPPGTKFSQVVAGDSSTFALTDTGSVYGWGTFRDANGIYGFTLDPGSHSIVNVQKNPLLIPNLPPIKQLSAGADYVLALSTSGHIYSWGCGAQHELGRRLLQRRLPLSLLPTQVGFPKKSIEIASVHAATNHAFAIDTNGQTWAWGSNNYGQTGVVGGLTKYGVGGTIIIPELVTSLSQTKMKAIDGGIHHSVGLTQDGRVLVWGRIDGGQSGLDISALPFLNDKKKVIFDEYGKPRILLQPTPVPVEGKGVHVVAGSDHCIAVTDTGAAYSWGFNATYQCGQGNDDDVPIAKRMIGKNVRDRKIVWAGAGGQYSMLASDMGN